MSFIYTDEDLISQLIRLAQSPAPPSEDGSSKIELAKQLVKDLKNQLAGGFSFTAERADADLSQAHVVNADELLNFLEFNGIKANNRDLVLNAREFVDSATGKMTNLAQSMGEAAKDYVQYPAQGKPTYYLYRDGLLAFLNDLLNKAVNNPMLKAIVTKLKGQLSSVLPEKVAPHTEAAGGGNTPQANPQQQGQRQQNQQVNAQIIAQIVSILPFTRNAIDFNRIDAFFGKVGSLMSNVPQVASQIADAQKLMASFNQSYMSTRVISLSINADQFSKMFASPLQKDRGQYILPAIDTLDRIIDATRVVVDEFYAAYTNYLSGPQRSYVLGQIGESADDTSLYSDNVEALRNMRGTPTMQAGK